MSSRTVMLKRDDSFFSLDVETFRGGNKVPGRPDKTLAGGGAHALVPLICSKDMRDCDISILQGKTIRALLHTIVLQHRYGPSARLEALETSPFRSRSDQYGAVVRKRTPRSGAHVQILLSTCLHNTRFTTTSTCQIESTTNNTSEACRCCGARPRRLDNQKTKCKQPNTPTRIQTCEPHR